MGFFKLCLLSKGKTECEGIEDDTERAVAFPVETG